MCVLLICNKDYVMCLCYNDVVVLDKDFFILLICNMKCKDGNKKIFIELFLS